MTYPPAWYERVDEWQHDHAPATTQLAWLWDFLWLPLCNYNERKIWGSK